MPKPLIKVLDRRMSSVNPLAGWSFEMSCELCKLKAELDLVASLSFEVICRIVETINKPYYQVCS